MPALKCAGQKLRDAHRRICIVALSDVKQPRNSADIAEFEFVEAVFAAGERQDHAVGRNLFRQLRIVVASGLGAVAAADQEEVTDLSGFDRIDDCAAAAATASWPNPTVMFFSGSVSGNPGARFAASITVLKSPFFTCTTPGNSTRPVVKIRSM